MALTRTSVTTSTTTATTSTTTIAATPPTLAATPAPTTTLPYVENSGTRRLAWGAQFTVIDQGVPNVDPRVLAALDVANATRRPCPSTQAITLAGQRFLSGTGSTSTAAITGAVEAVPLPDGGSIVTRAEAVPGGRSFLVNAFYVDAAGDSTRLTDYVITTSGRAADSLIVGHLRMEPSGRIAATLQQLPPPRSTRPPQSTELVIDPMTRTISAVATGRGLLVFDEDLAGNAVAGMERPGATDWRYQDATPIGNSGCEPAAPAG
jgi:hypothetical protein